MYETVLYEKDNGVANIALNRPEKLNAFDGTMHDELYTALGEAAEDEEIRCIVLRGEGRGFSAGADLAQIVREADGDPDLGEYLRNTYSRLVKRMVGVEKPIVAALHGPVYGAGVGVALACDLRVAAQSAKFSVAFIKIGLMPDAGVTFLLPRVVGLGRAMEMSMLGDAVDAEEAYTIGLVNNSWPTIPSQKRRETWPSASPRCRRVPWVGSNAPSTPASRQTSKRPWKARPKARRSAVTRRITKKASRRSSRSARRDSSDGRGGFQTRPYRPSSSWLGLPGSE